LISLRFEEQPAYPKRNDSLPKEVFMLQEYKSIRQHNSEYRRLFKDDEFELYVFYEREGNQMSGFQLVHNEMPSAHVLVWDRDRGLHHYIMEDASGIVLVPAPRKDIRHLARYFSAAARAIDRDVFDYVEPFLNG
jgi:hypothetical protein